MTTIYSFDSLDKKYEIPSEKLAYEVSKDILDKLKNLTFEKMPFMYMKIDDNILITRGFDDIYWKKGYDSMNDADTVNNKTTYLEYNRLHFSSNNFNFNVSAPLYEINIYNSEIRTLNDVYNYDMAITLKDIKKDIENAKEISRNPRIFAGFVKYLEREEYITRHMGAHRTKIPIYRIKYLSVIDTTSPSLSVAYPDSLTNPDFKLKLGGRKKKLKQTFKHKRNKKSKKNRSKKNRSKKNKSKKGGRQSN